MNLTFTPCLIAMLSIPTLVLILLFGFFGIPYIIMKFKDLHYSIKKKSEKISETFNDGISLIISIKNGIRYTFLGLKFATPVIAILILVFSSHFSLKKCHDEKTVQNLKDCGCVVKTIKDKI